jgi:hypothetical protein
MKNTRGAPPRPKSAPRHRKHSSPAMSAPAEEAADQAADESGNRALHSVASGPNPNVGRDDVERVPPERPGEGSIEST